MTVPLTSMLFVPGGDERKLAKVPDLRAPALILDLEDAVAVSRKPAARVLVAEQLRTTIATPRWVRVNTDRPAMTTADLDAVVGPNLAGVLLPKVQSREDVLAVDWYLSALEERRGLEPGSVLLMPTIESVAGLSQVEAIAAASPRVHCLVFGAGDFSLDAGLDWPQPTGVSELLLEAKRRLVLASRLAGIAPPHDGAFPLFKDEERLRAEAEQARALGMFGKHAIHPGQVSIIDAVFTPAPSQIERAQRIVEQFEALEADGVGNVPVGDLFVDYPVVERARGLLALAGQLAGVDGNRPEGER
ncbi:MAG: HpcH/HpaI aldolase/citrate lyase family protein [Motilibacteraceae bacterium]